MIRWGPALSSRLRLFSVSWSLERAVWAVSRGAVKESCWEGVSIACGGRVQRLAVVEEAVKKQHSAKSLVQSSELYLHPPFQSRSTAAALTGFRLAFRRI